MITKMTKFSFVMLRSDAPQFLSRLQELGMVDINREDKAIDTLSKEWSDKIAQYNQCALRLKATEKMAQEEAKANKLRIPQVVPFKGTPSELLAQANKLYAENDTLKVELDSLHEQIAQARPWGEFTREDLDKIAQSGVTLHAYCVPEKRFLSQWEQEYPMQVIRRENGNVYFVVLQTPDVPYEFPQAETTFPAISYTDLTEKLEEKQHAWDLGMHHLAELSCNAPMLKAESLRIATDLDRYLAQEGGELHAEGYLSLMTGFVPSTEKEHLETFLEKESLYYTSSPAEVEDNPPVKLKNNWFARLFEPIGDLYMLPTYNELDLTPYFAPFYMLFFGLCLGDMGYGLLLMLVGIFGRKFVPKMKSYLNLVILLGLGTVLMGSLSGVFFGTKVSDWLPAVKSQNFIFMLTDMNMFWFAILFGLFQIIFARVMHGIDMCIRKGWQAGMSSFGWAILITWCTVAYASTSVPALAIPKNISLILVCLSVVLIIFFSKPEGPVYKRVGPGLWAMYDITSVFGDMLSYIRLFGLGTAGGILGMVMNQIALSLSGVPIVGWLLTLVVLLFGHSLVLGLNVLGAFVHPLRLTFVEFYKNAGFSGGGRTYRPLKNNKNE